MTAESAAFPTAQSQLPRFLRLQLSVYTTYREISKLHRFTIQDIGKASPLKPSLERRSKPTTMSNQGYYDQSQNHPSDPTHNPWSNQQGTGNLIDLGGEQQQHNAPGYPPQHQQQPQDGGYAPPPGPPPGQLPKRTGTFEETDFIPEHERGEQREAMQQYEMNQTGNESQQDRDVAELQRLFPNVDGSLIAAIHADSGGNMGATKEVLSELASQS